MQRIVALGAAHDVLFAKGWGGAHVQDIAAATLAPLVGDGRLEVTGPDLAIGAHSAVSLALVLHELATNAMKYGALSNAEGRILLNWDFAGDALSLTWRETGGPAVSPPQRLGFGSRLIDMGLSPQGSVQRRYLPEGFTATITAPYAEVFTG
jgi:two-component sensor histidine kinase